MVDGLTSHDQRSNNVIDPDQFFLRCSDAGTGFFPLRQIIRMSFGRCVVGVLFLAGFLLRTTGAYIGRLVQQFAVTGNIPVTQLSAVSLGTKLTARKTAVSRMFRTDCVFQTGEEVNTVVVRIIVKFPGKDTMLVHLSGDG